MNTSPVTVVGNLTSDPELKFLGNGSAKLGFSVACDRSYKKGDEWEKETSFFNVVAWRNTAENAADVLAKGLRVTVIGRLEQRSWEDKETGERRTTVEVVADEIAVSVAAIDGINRRPRNGEGAAAPRAAARSAAKPKADPVPDEEAW
jgi:single-strand DNA-binding protein